MYALCLARILDALGLDSKMVTNKYTPAEAKPLTRNEDGEGPQGSFSYASVVGMLLYLSGHTRPDIAYAVNCCARYMFSPRLSHEQALKRIGRYLKVTRDKGLILKPCPNLRIDAFPDANFAGLYGYAKITCSEVVKSRTGFLITVCQCPMVWVSKLQTETQWKLKIFLWLIVAESYFLSLILWRNWATSLVCRQKI
jgi:hypothetical protein